MIPGLGIATGGGGFSGSSSSESTAGPVTAGGFIFAPKSGSLPTAAWVAIAAVALALVLIRGRS